ncbi:MAG: Transcriptional regulator, AcrR family [Firmicutes bacterium]|nr:Transcriptional regulator, AcrR family [Bacillota bacterium]MDI6707339.1 TetR/AcrR family transcriptional regulator [Bacillota bacterium]
MFSKFLSLEKEKQERILNAALKEFAQKGYDDASTNEIVKEAGISKGLLFHYFNTKKDLFLFLYDYSVEITKTEYYGLINTNERDIFTRLRQIYLLKLEVYHKHPWLFDFTKVAVYTESKEVKAEMESRKKDVLSTGYEKLFENIDVSKFKDGVDVKRAMKIIFWAIGGFGNEILEEVKELELSQVDYDGILSEFDAYLEMLRKCFYK